MLVGVTSTPASCLQLSVTKIKTINETSFCSKRLFNSFNSLSMVFCQSACSHSFATSSISEEFPSAQIGNGEKQNKKKDREVVWTVEQIKLVTDRAITETIWHTLTHLLCNPNWQSVTKAPMWGSIKIFYKTMATQYIQMGARVETHSISLLIQFLYVVFPHRTKLVVYLIQLHPSDNQMNLYSESPSWVHHFWQNWLDLPGMYQKEKKNDINPET